MSSVKKWVIATNGSKYASEAVKYAAELYKDLHTEPEVYILVVAIAEDKEAEGKAILELAKYKFEDIAGKEANIQDVLDFGDPGKVIIKQFKKLKADHLYIGGSDFKWDVNSDEPGGVSNYIIENLSGGITLIK